jgi:hypothetical protein
VYLGLVHGVRELACDALDTGRPAPIAKLTPEIMRWLTATLKGA